MNKLGYRFPYNDGGRNVGINDGSIEFFSGKPIYYMTKETIQNSLDAKLSNDNPVKVKFKLHRISRGQFPYLDQMKDIIESCMEFAEERNDKETVRFMNKALEELQRETISILEISDYNTTGLVGAEGEMDTPFSNLVKSTGISNKLGEAGGSFGIGKNAPFVCSNIRSIIYSTLDKENVLAVQGVSNLSTHGRHGMLTQATGFLGVTEESEDKVRVHRPFLMEETNNLNKVFVREEVGTSIFVMAFSEDHEWEMQITQAVIDYYFSAVLDRALIVEVGEKIIDKNTLGDILEKNKDNWNNILTREYYTAYKNKEDTCHVIKEDFEGMGIIKLYLNLDKDLPKRIAYVRGAGMKIIDKDRIRVTQSFAGVLKFEGKKISEFIRSLENPSHDKLETARYKKHGSESHAKQIMSKLNVWIKDKINQFNVYNELEQMDIHAVGKYLPQELGRGEIQADIKEPIRKKIEKIDESKINKLKKSKPLKIKEDDENEILDEKPNKNKEDKDKKDKDKHKKHSDENKKNLVFTDITRSRVFCIDPACGKYRVIIKSRNKSNSYLQLKIVGEEGAEIAELKNVAEVNSSASISVVNENKFGPISFKKNEEKYFDLTLKRALRCSMEVQSSADNN
ncbi:hypothetical protein CGQ39_15445 [Clostridium botulinum]|uniref:hypothetical protein n=1 Tax=Clostridium botulinum TaxID=1491 RepID=UPI0022053A1F|nr:hypothetical protein [Clostridium botulinum]QDY22288.1 hypothetical protein CGQ39_15445 [Clostridium botulinum]